MAQDINRVCLSGNLTRDPEIRYTQSGTPVMGFGMAVNDRRKNSNTGEWEDYANFLDCTMFGSRTESVSQYLLKGSKVMVEGKLRYSSWERDGQKRSKVEIVIDDIVFAGQRQQAQQAPQHHQAQPNQNQYAAPQQGGQQYMATRSPVADTSSVYDEDIPF